MGAVTIMSTVLLEDPDASEPLRLVAGPTRPEYALRSWTVTVTPVKGAPRIAYPVWRNSVFIAVLADLHDGELETGADGLPVRLVMTGERGTTLYERADAVRADATGIAELAAAA